LNLFLQQAFSFWNALLTYIMFKFMTLTLSHSTVYVFLAMMQSWRVNFFSVVAIITVRSVLQCVFSATCGKNWMVV